MKISGIYKIESIIKPEKIYIGSAINIGNRWRGHLSRLRKNRHMAKLQNHVNKYGIEDLKFSVIEECSNECLLNREQYYIEELKPWFNARTEADRNTGFKHSVETKLRMSILRSGDKHPLFGKHCSEERKKNISNSLKGSIPWNKGKKNIYSEETLQKMRKEKTKETKEKLSLIAKQRYGTRKRNERGQFA